CALAKSSGANSDGLACTTVGAALGSSWCNPSTTFWTRSLEVDDSGFSPTENEASGGLSAVSDATLRSSCAVPFAVEADAVGNGALPISRSTIKSMGTGPVLDNTKLSGRVSETR